MMKRVLGTAILALGIDPRRLWRSLLGFPRYFRSSFLLLKAVREKRTEGFGLVALPVLSDSSGDSGVARGHYFHQDLWAARRIFQINPEKHVDVGSRIDGFVAHLLTFRQATVIDVRPLSSKVSGLTFIQRDMMSISINDGLSSDSVSSLHALEHFGLGRYGDPFDIDGWKRGLENIATLVIPGGRLYLSVPIGPQRIEFNAHRIFSPTLIISTAVDLGLDIFDFSYVDDAGDFHQSAQVKDTMGCRFGCGCFEFVKRDKGANGQ